MIHILAPLLVGTLAWGCAAAVPAPTSQSSAPDAGTAAPSPGLPSPTPGPSGQARSPDASATPPAEPSPSVSGLVPSPTDGTKPLPECRYADRPTRYAARDDWRITLLDPTYRLPADYVPERLVSTARAGLQSGYEVRPEVVEDLRAMAEASREADAEIAVRWAYRSYGEQAGAFAYWTRQAGYERALEISARPGHSEHQLGSALDFRSADSLQAPWDYDDWGLTPAGTWMRENSWRYGFVLSYPRNMSDETCYAYEPWHFRYVGRELAMAVRESGHSLRRYLWENFEAPAGGE